MANPSPDTPSPGQSTKLTPEVQELICEELRNGRPASIACGIVGIEFNTYKNWMKWGSGDPPDSKRSTWPSVVTVYRQFFAAVKQARGEASAEHLENIRAAGKDPKYWTASAWWLERTDPENFGRREAPTVVID